MLSFVALLKNIKNIFDLEKKYGQEMKEKLNLALKMEQDDDIS